MRHGWRRYTCLTSDLQVPQMQVLSRRACWGMRGLQILSHHPRPCRGSGAVLEKAQGTVSFWSQSRKDQHGNCAAAKAEVESPRSGRQGLSRTSPGPLRKPKGLLSLAGHPVQGHLGRLLPKPTHLIEIKVFHLASEDGHISRRGGGWHSSLTGLCGATDKLWTFSGRLPSRRLAGCITEKQATVTSRRRQHSSGIRSQGVLILPNGLHPFRLPT